MNLASFSLNGFIVNKLEHGIYNTVEIYSKLCQQPTRVTFDIHQLNSNNMNTITFARDYQKHLNLNLNDKYTLTKDEIAKFIKLQDNIFTVCNNLAIQDKKDISKARCELNVRALTGIKNNTGKTLNKWHVDNSYITCVLSLNGIGTDIVTNCHMLEDVENSNNNPNYKIKPSILTIEEDYCVYMTGTARTIDEKYTIHRAPNTCLPRLIAANFYYLD